MSMTASGKYNQTRDTSKRILSAARGHASKVYNEFRIIEY